MNFEKIRERIDYKGELKPTYEVLKALQKQFLLHVPFENLDIHMGIPLNYSYENVFVITSYSIHYTKLYDVSFIGFR